MLFTDNKSSLLHAVSPNQLSSNSAWQTLLKSIFLTGAMKSIYILSKLGNNPVKDLGYQCAIVQWLTKILIERYDENREPWMGFKKSEF